MPNNICKSVDAYNLKAVKQAIAEAGEVYAKTDLLINCTGVMLLSNAEV